MDLTNKAPAKKWFSKAMLLWLLALIVIALILWAILSGRLGSKSESAAYGEDQLPAIKVVVLNGCGYDQLASEFAAHLSRKNIDVISVGNTPRPVYDKSIIVIRKGDMHDLARLQRMTGIQRWTSAENEYHSADFDVIVGRDYEQFMN